MKTINLLKITLLMFLTSGYQSTTLLAFFSSENSYSILPSDDKNIMPIPTTPSSPTNLITEPRINAIHIKFDVPLSDGESIINYEYTLDDGNSWIPFQPTVTSSPVLITGLTPCIEYNIRLRAVSPNGPGIASEQVSNTPRNGKRLGRDWITRTIPQGPSSWKSITYGNGIYVAVADNGPYKVMISSDATAWSVVENVPDANWTAVSYGNGLY